MHTFTLFVLLKLQIFIGKTELELPETRKRMGDKASYVNIYPFVWNKYKEAGYITGMFYSSIRKASLQSHRMPASCTATDTSLRTICIGNSQQLDAFFIRKRMRHRSPVLKLLSGGVHI
jgi:hypothetical protein